MADVPLEKNKAENKTDQRGAESGQRKPSGQYQSRGPHRRRMPYNQNRNRRYQQRPMRGRSGVNYRRGYRARRKVCAFCVDKVKVIGWKEADRFRRFINDGGGMRSRRKTGTCAKHQRRLAVAIKRARHMALLPYTVEHVRIMSKG